MKRNLVFGQRVKKLSKYFISGITLEMTWKQKESSVFTDGETDKAQIAILLAGEQPQTFR